MIIKTKINSKDVVIELRPFTIKNEGGIGFSVAMMATGVNWEGKNGTKLEASDKDFQEFMNYIDKAEFMLPPINQAELG